MAIPFLRQEKAVSRRLSSKSRSAVAAAAYRAGECLMDAETGEVHDYTKRQRRQEVLAAGVVLPAGVDPGWTDRERLWNAAHAADRTPAARLARNLVGAVPHELPAAAQERIAERFAAFLAERHGVAVDWALHEADKDGDDRNRHTHFLITTRRLHDGGFGGKARELDDRKTGPAHAEAWRQKWGEIVNSELQQAGLSVRIDMRSYAKQGIDRKGGVHLGPNATALERRGIQTDKGRANRRVAFRNRQAAAARQYSARITATGRPITRATLAEIVAAAGLELRRQERQGRRWMEVIDPTKPKGTAVPIGRLPVVSDALKAEHEQQAEARRQQQAQAQQQAKAASAARRAGAAAKRLMQASDSAAEEAKAGFQAGQAAAEAAAAITAALGRWGQQRAAAQAVQAVQQATDRRPAVGEITETGAKRLGLGQPNRGQQPQAVDPAAIAARQKRQSGKHI